MTTLHHAPYCSDADDFPRVLAFLRDIGQHPEFLADMHPGDAVWQRFRAGSSAFDPATRIALWADERGRDVALGWLDPPDTWLCVVHPAVLPTETGAAAVAAVLAWIEERRAQSASDGSSPGATTVSALDEDTRLTALLRDHGFTPEPELDLVTTRQSLDNPIPACALTAGYRVVDLTDPSFVEQRVAIHLEVWYPSVVSLAGYQEMQRQPLYDPALDLMAITEEGEPAAYVLNWLDSPTRTALFEPVGTRVAHRRRGLSRALLAEGMRRARDRGATVQYVNHVGDATNPSVPLYRAAGFRPVGHWRLWTQGDGQ